MVSSGNFDLLLTVVVYKLLNGLSNEDGGAATVLFSTQLGESDDLVFREIDLKRYHAIDSGT